MVRDAISEKFKDPPAVGEMPIMYSFFFFGKEKNLRGFNLDASSPEKPCQSQLGLENHFRLRLRDVLHGKIQTFYSVQAVT